MKFTKVISIAVIMLLATEADALQITKDKKALEKVKTLVKAMKAQGEDENEDQKPKDQDMWESHVKFNGKKKKPMDDLVEAAKKISPIGASTVGRDDSPPIAEVAEILKKADQKKSKKNKSADLIAQVKEEVDKEKKQSEKDSDEKDDIEEETKEDKKAVKKVEKKAEQVIKKVV